MSRLDSTEDQWISVGISRWYDVAYAFHVSIVRDGEHHYFIVDRELNQYYLEHWTVDLIAEQNADFAEYKHEIQVLVNDAMTMWTFMEALE